MKYNRTIAIYDRATGQHLRSVTCPEAVVLEQVRDKAAEIGFLEQEDGHLFYFNGTNLTAMPPRPSPLHTFNYTTKKWDSPPYQEARAAAYPNIVDQLDALWHAMDRGDLPKVDGFYDKIKAVKQAHPKL